MKKLLIILLTLTPCLVTYAQDAGSTYNKCQQEAGAAYNKIGELDQEYEKIKGDLKAGLFCSDCNRSKTEIEKSGIGFYSHIAAGAKGGRRILQATQQQFQNAATNYQNKRSSLVNDYDRKKANCQDNYNRAVQADNERAQQEQQQAQRRQQEELRRQQEELNRKIKEDTEKAKAEAQKNAQEFADNKIAEINNINMPGSTINFGNVNNTRNILSPASIGNIDDENFNGWQEDAVKNLVDKNLTETDKNILTQMNTWFKDAKKTGDYFSIFKNSMQNIKQWTKGKMTDKLDEVLDNDPYLPSRTTDKNLDKLIDNNSSGQTKRNLHFIKNYVNDIGDRAVNFIDHFGEDDAAKNDFDGRTVFLENAPELFSERNTMKAVYNKVKDVVTDKRFIITAATWVLAPEIALPVAAVSLASYLMK